MRTVAYFALVFVVLLVLRQLPLVGGLFRIPLFGFLLAVAVVGVAAERLGRALTARRRFQRARAELGQVDTPHNQGKLGTLLLVAGRPKAAVEPLRAAVAGEPESAEWAYRLGCALLGSGCAPQAAEALERSVALDEDHAYGAALLRLAEARQASGAPQAALAVLERFERGRGDSAEAAYRKGLALRALDRRDEARRSFDEVGRLARAAPKYQKGEARGFAFRAALARWFG